jgi:hypothetical protein
MNRLYAIALSILISGFAHGKLKAAEKTWVGTSSNNWNQASNWQPSGVPVLNDDVIFDGTVSSINCNLGTTTVVKSIHILDSYTGLIQGADSPQAILTVQTLLQVDGGTIDLRRSRLKSMQQLLINGGSVIKGNSGICSIVNLEINSGSFIIADPSVEILGNCLLVGGQFQTGAGSFTIGQSWNQSGGTFSKTSGIGTFTPSGNLSMSGGTFNSNQSAITLKAFQFNGGQFIGGSGSIYCIGDLTLATDAEFTKSFGALYMNNGAKLISAGQFNLGITSFQANEIQLTGGTFNLGSSTVNISGPVSASNALVSKGLGTTNMALSQNSSFENCTINWGNGLLNTGNINLTNTQTSIGSGTLTIAGQFTQSGASSFTKSGGFTTIAVDNNLNLNGGSIDFSNCSQVITGVWKQSSGTAIHGSTQVTIRGNLEISGDAIYTASTGITSIEGDFRTSGGTFNHNNGVFRMNGTSSFTYRILGNPTFSILELVNEIGVDAHTYEIYGNVSVNSELRLKNGSALNRPITINTGMFWLYGNLNISAYRSTVFQPGSATIRFAGSNMQTIIGAPTSESIAFLPKIRIEKSGGQFNFINHVSLGNGFSHQNSDIQFDPSSVFCMGGGSFQVDNLFIPKVIVSGTAMLASNLIVLGDMSVLSEGLLINGTQPINVNGGFYNFGRFQTMSGIMNVSGALENHGEFAANSGSINALTGIQQMGGIFACNTGQVNVLGILSLQGGTFSCNNGIVQISGSLNQNGGTLNGNIGGGYMTVSQHFTQVGGTYDAQNGVLNIGGILTMNSLFIRNTGTINFNGIGPQSIPALFYNKLSIAGTGRLITLAPDEIRIGAATGGFAPNSSNAYITTNNTINYAGNTAQDVTGFAYNNLTLSRTGTKSLVGNSSVKTVLAVKNNAIFDADGIANNKIFTLLSTQSLTARIDQMPSTASIVGNATVQRWTRGGVRSNRFFSSPVDTIGGVKIKQFKDNILVYGNNGVANGFDSPTVFNSNIYLYDEPRPNGSEWRSPLNINEVIPTGKGILVYHLGDRSQYPLQGNAIPNPAVIDFKGTPNQGTLAVNMQCTGTCIVADNGNGWNLVANPYASPIDWDSPEWTKANLASTIYIWNPRINQYAQYNTANPGASTNGGSRYIGPGQSFFMKAIANDPVLIANEKVKTSTFPDTLLFRMSAPENQLRLVLHNAEFESRDEIVLAFDKNSTEAYEPQFDNYKPKLPMTVSNFAFVNEIGEKLGVHTFVKPQTDKRIPLQLDANSGAFSLTAEQLFSFDSDIEFYLENIKTGELQKLKEASPIQINIGLGQEESLSNNYALVLKKTNQSATSINSGIRAFPNPTNGDLISVWVSENEQGTLEIFDLRGNLISKQTINPSGNTIKTSALKNAAGGMYTITWTSTGSRYSTRVSVN